MSIKTKVFAAAATLTLIGGVGSAGALSAGAATPSCGHDCVNVFSRDFGKHSSPTFVVDVLRQGEKVGQPIILFRTSNSDPAEDFSVSFQGQVSDFLAAGLVSQAVALHYGCVPATSASSCKYFVNDPAFEVEYAPFGVDSGLCMGLNATAVYEGKVTLQPCGVSSKTVWIVDTNDSPATIRHGYVPLINGSDTNFSHPFVLSYPVSGYPTDKPRVQLEVTNLTGFQQGKGKEIGSVNSNQLWGADFGVLK
jgi:hypothetical protein